MKKRIGYRGIGLLCFTATCCLYGAGLVAGYHPTFLSAYGFSTHTFGWFFIALGLLSATGAPLKEDRYHYAFGTMCIAGWVLLLSTHWQAPFGWTAAVSWMSVCGAMVIAASWPEPVLHSHHQDQPVPDEQEAR